MVSDSSKATSNRHQRRDSNPVQLARSQELRAPHCPAPPRRHPPAVSAGMRMRCHLAPHLGGGHARGATLPTSQTPVERSRELRALLGRQTRLQRGTRERGGPAVVQGRPPGERTRTAGHSILTSRARARFETPPRCRAARARRASDLLLLKKHVSSSSIFRLTVEGAHRTVPSSGSNCTQRTVRHSSAPPERADAWT